MDRYLILGKQRRLAGDLDVSVGTENDLDAAKQLAESYAGSDDMSWIQTSDTTWILMSRGINTGIVIHQRPGRKGNES